MGTPLLRGRVPGLPGPIMAVRATSTEQAKQAQRKRTGLGHWLTQRRDAATVRRVRFETRSYDGGLLKPAATIVFPDPDQGTIGRCEFPVFTGKMRGAGEDAGAV